MNTSPLPPEVVGRLPSPQGVAFALNRACRSDHVNLYEIANLVRTDPALSGRLLALANSAATGGRSVISVDDAVARIGVAGVSQVALAFSLIDQYASGVCTNFNYAGFWSQSLLMASSAKEFGTARKLGVAAELFTLGLLAQIGRLAMATAFPAEYSDLIVQDLDRGDLVLQETHLLGTNHLALSGQLLTDWGIPAEMVRPFCRYELPDPCTQQMGLVENNLAQLASSAWHVASVIAHESTDAVFEQAECMASLAWLGLDDETLRGHLGEIETTWRFWLTLISRP
jgi:HD-like signal output (HDOD) protein